MSIRNLILSAALIFAGYSIQAQSDYSAHQEGWLVNLEEAYAESKETGKPIMANFTGSDWCGWCKKLSASVFNKPEFKEWADDNVVLLELDFPRRFQVPSDIKKQNADMQRAFNVRGFPTIWVFDLDRDATEKFNITAYGKTGYKPTVEQFTSEVEAFMSQAKRENGAG